MWLLISYFSESFVLWNLKAAKALLKIAFLQNENFNFGKDFGAAE